jgi:hypothetical protein
MLGLRSCGTWDNCGYNRSDTHTPAAHSDHIRIHGLPAQACGIGVCPRTPVDDRGASYHRTFGGTRSRSVARYRLLRPRRLSSRSIMSHDFIDLFLDVRHCTLSQMHIDKRAGDGLVAQERLNHAKMDPGLHQMGGLRMSQRMTANVLLYFALPDGGFQATLDTVGRNGHGALLGGEQEDLGSVFEPIQSQLGQRVNR